MPVASLDVASLVELRLDNKDEIFGSVESLFDFSYLKGKTIPKDNIAYVGLVSERPINSTSDSSGNSQTIECTVGVVMGIHSRNDRTGIKGNALLQQSRELLKSTLLGWMPSDADSAFKFKSSNLVEVAKNGIWWMEQFTVTYYLYSPLQNE